MKAVLFDLGGTLWEPFGRLTREEVIESAAKEAAACLPDERLREIGRAEEVVPRVAAIESPQRIVSPTDSGVAARRLEFACYLGSSLANVLSVRAEAIRRGDFSDPGFKEYTAEQQVSKAFRELWSGALRDLDHRPSASAYGDALTRYSTPYAESADVLTRLKAEFPGVKVGVVSNTGIQPEVLDRYLKNGGLYDYLDFRVYSSAAGWRKPHPAIYALALAEAGVRAEDAVFVGDRIAEDVTGPKRLGMKAVLCCREATSSEGSPYAVVPDLTTLPEILRAM